MKDAVGVDSDFGRIQVAGSPGLAELVPIIIILILK